MIVRPFVTEQDIVAVRHDETLSEAARRMRARRVGSALVSPQPRGAGFGIITERDLCVRWRTALILAVPSWPPT
jgi:CBS domain-containing protein